MTFDMAEDAVRDLPGLLTTDEAAEFFKVCKRTLARWIASGRIKAVRLTPTGSGGVRVPRAEVRRALEGMAGR